MPQLEGFISCRYMEEMDLAVMLVTKSSAGVTLQMNLKELTYASAKCE